MGKSHISFDIVLDSDIIFLRGTSIHEDSEPATLSGIIALHLAEATSFKEITMTFRGKSCTPIFESNSQGLPALSDNYQKNVFFTHNSSFLENGYGRSTVLVAGRHAFPFRFQLDGSLPPSLTTSDGLGSVNYQLHATAVRSGFAFNHHASARVRLIHSFTAGAFEYQQPLEIENTWPSKLMYSLMVPHKAWAAGDTVVTVVKFSPLLKGVCICSITTTVEEELSIFTNVGSLHQKNRVIAKAIHELRDGRAVAVQLNDLMTSNYLRTPFVPSTSSRTATSSTCEGASVPTAFTMPMPPFYQHNPQASDMGNPQVPLELGSDDVVATIPVTLLRTATPSRDLGPFFISHRICWRIRIGNLDGHISELRCSLPIHILDHALLDEARLATLAMRRPLCSPEDLQWLGEMELPSYPAHVLDRVAAPHLPESPITSNNRVESSAASDSVPSAPLPISLERRRNRISAPILLARRTSPSSRTESPKRRNRFSLSAFIKVLCGRRSELES